MNKRAFTLTEIIISTVIIGLVLAGTFSAFVATQYIFNRASHRAQAFNFAREAQDRLRSNYEYDSDSEMAVGTDKDELESIVRGELLDLGATLRYDVSEEPTGGYKEVAVSVTWTETRELL
ncbi:type II secretion system protein [Candidatus Omnitrophota bacterium]